MPGLETKGADRHADRRTPLEKLLTQFDQQLDAHVTEHHGGDKNPLAYKAEVAAKIVAHFDKIRMESS